MIIILLIIIIIFAILLFSKKEGFNLSSEVYNNINNLCNKKSLSLFNGLNISSNSLINNDQLDLYILNVLYPIGSFYVQYPDANSLSTTIAFPENKKPNNLFPGTTWVEQWNTDGVFFRTEGVLSDINRTDGTQNYAMKRLNGTLSWMQPDDNAPGAGATGVFDVETGYIYRDDGGSNDPIFHNYFDSSIQVQSSDNEIRVKNRLIKVWKRTA
jgi:hypothetical protein